MAVRNCGTTVVVFAVLFVTVVVAVRLVTVNNNFTLTKRKKIKLNLMVIFLEGFFIGDFHFI